MYTYEKNSPVTFDNTILQSIAAEVDPQKAQEDEAARDGVDTVVPDTENMEPVPGEDELEEKAGR